MIPAIGYAQDHFNARAPGHLCRGRERWIEYDGVLPPVDEADPIYRLVVSGAAFTDDSARDARRGLQHSTVELPALMTALFGDEPVLAYCEEGHPRMVPDTAVGLEPHGVTRPGGPLRQWVCRWAMTCQSSEDIAMAAAAGADVFLVGAKTTTKGATPIMASPHVPRLADEPEPSPGLLSEETLGTLYMLTGFRTEGRPTRRFQPAAIPELLDHAKAIVLLHLDKHGPCTGIYSQDPLDIDGSLQQLAQNAGELLVVPFAIPPMLARWDRALWELRQNWDEASQGEFPVPPCPTRRQRETVVASEE